jgi:hypothetical protein
MIYLMVLPVLFLLILIEIMNRYRYKKLKIKLSIIKNTENDRIEKATLFTEMHATAMNNYSSFMMKHVINDNFFDIFTSYYQDGMMNTIRIRDVVRKYIFDLDPTKKTNTYNTFSSDIPVTAIEAHKTINVLTKKFENIYVINSGNDLDSVMKEWNDLTDVIMYKNSFKYLVDHVHYIRFSILMRCSGYRYQDMSPDIRIWIKGEICDDRVVNVVIIDDDVKNSMMTNHHNHSKDNNIVYIEIKGFSNYSDFFDVITCDMLNRYSSIDDVTKQFNNVLKLFTKSKINLFASREMTVIVPYFVNYYDNKIDKIVVINPIYYPYSFHIFFKSIHNKKIDLYLKPNLVRMFNGLSLMQMYFDKNAHDKKFNRLYGRNVNVDFDKDSELYTNQENLSIVLDMYSHVRVIDRTDKNIDTEKIRINKTITENVEINMQ